MSLSSNVVVIMTDQHSPKMLSCYGHPQVKTPNLDSLAASGVRFTSAYTPSPLCVPARASFATGRYVHEIGCWDNAIAWAGQPEGWPQKLPSAGHETVSIGKLHFRSEEDPIGFSQRILPMHIADGVGELSGSIRPDLPRRTQGRKLAEDIGPGETSYTAYDRNITNEAISWITKTSNSPPRDEEGNTISWVLYISYICPHFPLSAPIEFYDLYDLNSIVIPKPYDPEHIKRYPWWEAFHNSILFDEYFKDDLHRRKAIANYYGLVSFADDNIGKVINALKNTNSYKNTHIFYTSDHGDNLGARKIWGKGTMHEESAGVPLIVSGPKIKEKSTINTPVSLLDIYPSILDSLNLATSERDNELPGSSLFKIVENKSQEFSEREILSEYHAAGATSGVFMIRKGVWKYIHYTGYHSELFNLEDDPEELKNLSHKKEYANILKDLMEVLYNKLKPETPESIDTRAKLDQANYIEEHGGRDFVLTQAQIHGSPVPGGESTRV